MGLKTSGFSLFDSEEQSHFRPMNEVVRTTAHFAKLRSFENAEKAASAELVAVLLPAGGPRVEICIRLQCASSTLSKRTDQFCPFHATRSSLNNCYRVPPLIDEALRLDSKFSFRSTTWRNGIPHKQLIH